MLTRYTLLLLLSVRPCAILWGGCGHSIPRHGTILSHRLSAHVLWCVLVFDPLLIYACSILCAGDQFGGCGARHGGSDGYSFGVLFGPVAFIVGFAGPVTGGADTVQRRNGPVVGLRKPRIAGAAAVGLVAVLQHRGGSGLRHRLGL